MIWVRGPSGVMIVRLQELRDVTGERNMSNPPNGNSIPDCTDRSLNGIYAFCTVVVVPGWYAGDMLPKENWSPNMSGNAKPADTSIVDDRTATMAASVKNGKSSSTLIDLPSSIATRYQGLMRRFISVYRKKPGHPQP